MGPSFDRQTDAIASTWLGHCQHCKLKASESQKKSIPSHCTGYFATSSIMSYCNPHDTWQEEVIPLQQISHPGFFGAQVINKDDWSISAMQKKTFRGISMCSMARISPFGMATIHTWPATHHCPPYKVTFPNQPRCVKQVRLGRQNDQQVKRSWPNLGGYMTLVNLPPTNQRWSQNPTAVRSTKRQWLMVLILRCRSHST